MNVNEKHASDKGVSAQSLFKGETGAVIALQILKGEMLAEHITKIPAMLLCINGEVVFNNEKGIELALKAGDYVDIEPLVKHWVKGVEDSQLVLMK